MSDLEKYGITEMKLPEIDPVAVRRLANDYRLDYAMLSERLPWIAHGVSVISEFKKNEPCAKTTGRYIKAMRNAAAVLRQKINTVPRDSSFHAQLFYRYKKLYMLGKDLDELVAVLDGLDPLGRKEDGDKAGRDSLIQQLARLWKVGTGKPATLSTKPGQFIAFMSECADLFGIDSTPLPARFTRLREKYKGTDLEI